MCFKVIFHLHFTNNFLQYSAGGNELYTNCVINKYLCHVVCVMCSCALNYFSENDDGDLMNNRMPQANESCLDSYAFYGHQNSCLAKAP